jgi:hypothetical protein
VGGAVERVGLWVVDEEYGSMMWWAWGRRLWRDVPGSVGGGRQRPLLEVVRYTSRGKKVDEKRTGAVRP